MTAETDALRRERAGYVARGLTDRVRMVDAELARLGEPVPAETSKGGSDGPVKRQGRSARPGGRD